MVNSRRRSSTSGPRPSGLGVAEIELCLDFINTEGIERNSPPDRLETLDLFLEWAIDKQLVEEGAAKRLQAAASEKEVASFLVAARAFREALYRILSGLITAREPVAADLTVLDGQIARALSRLGLERAPEGFRWVLAEGPEEPADLLLPIALAAADLLRSDRLDRLKECGGETCSWMFLDASRNRSRRWCDMSDCGNRAKARRFYRRHADRG